MHVRIYVIGTREHQLFKILKIKDNIMISLFDQQAIDEAAENKITIMYRD